MHGHDRKRPQAKGNQTQVHKRRRLTNADATSLVRSPAVGHVSPVVVESEPVTWPLSESYSQRELLRELRPRRQPMAQSSSYYKRFHSFSNMMSNTPTPWSVMALEAPTPWSAQPSSANATCITMHIGSDLESSRPSADRKRSLLQVTLERDDLDFLSKQSKLTCDVRQCPPNNMSTLTNAVSSSSGSNNISTTIRRKYCKVALCVKGHGLSPNGACSIDSYCEACHG